METYLLSLIDCILADTDTLEVVTRGSLRSLHKKYYIVIILAGTCLINHMSWFGTGNLNKATEG